MQRQRLDKVNRWERLKQCIFLFSFLCWQHIGAQTNSSQDSVRIFFRQGIDTLDLNYRDNEETLNRFSRRLIELNDRRVRYGNVRISSSASPEGPSALNETLAKNRAKVLLRYMQSHEELSEVEFEVMPVELDWNLFRQLVDNSDFPEKEQVMYILTKEPENIRKRLLKNLKSGRVWTEMLRSLYPDMRTCVLYLHYAPREGKISSEWIKPDIPLSVYSLETPVQNRESGRRTRFLMGVKTNLLYDVLAIPNLGVEFYLGKGWSVGGSWMYAWWKRDKSNLYWRSYGGELDVRKYFGRTAVDRPLSGHHVGVYGQMLTYDFEVGGRGYIGGKPGGTLWEKAHYGVGLEYGYSLPVGTRLNLDFSLGLGYLGGICYEYLPADKYYVWQTTKRRHWIGPTKAEVSLVWLLGNGITNREKRRVRQ